MKLEWILYLINQMFIIGYIFCKFFPNFLPTQLPTHAQNSTKFSYYRVCWKCLLCKTWKFGGGENVNVLWRGHFYHTLSSLSTESYAKSILILVKVWWVWAKKVEGISFKNKTALNIANVSYSFTQFSTTLAKTYTTTAREPSIYFKP